MKISPSFCVATENTGIFLITPCNSLTEYRQSIQLHKEKLAENDSLERLLRQDRRAHAQMGGGAEGIAPRTQNRVQSPGCRRTMQK